MSVDVYIQYNQNYTVDPLSPQVSHPPIEPNMD